jgi:hypothetical protein
MNLINESDKKLIQELCDWKISKSDFENKTNFKANYDQLNYLLDNTKKDFNNKNGDNRSFREIFWNVSTILSIQEEISVFRKYLLKNWHHEHEEIAGSFQAFFHNDKENIPILLEAINDIPKYLQIDDLKYSYIRKIIYAIGAQPETYNIEALEELADETNDKQIKELALHQIEKRKKLGRWESKKKI